MKKTIKSKTIRNISLFICCLIIPNTAKAVEKIVISTFEYPYLISQSKIPGKGNGFHADIAIAAFNAVDVETELKIFPMKRAAVNIVEGRYVANLGTIKHYTESQRKNDVTSILISHGRYFLEKFRKGFKIIKENGTFLEIAERYYGKGNVPKAVLDIMRGN